MVVQVGALVEGNIVKKFGIIGGHGVYVAV